MATGADTESDPAAFTWKETPGQAVWSRIALAFLVFYLGEAVLFWRGIELAGGLVQAIPFGRPLLYPLGYWGLFGFVVYRLQRRPAAVQADGAAARFRWWQGALLTGGITVGVVGTAFVVIQGSGSPTLGHVALFFGMFLAAAVIGAMELNIGWLSAAGFWLVSAIGINVYPADWNLVPKVNDEDVWVGLAIVLGFVLVGRLPRSVDQSALAPSAKA